jgi:hypothetical protein
VLYLATRSGKEEKEDDEHDREEKATRKSCRKGRGGDEDSVPNLI